MVVTLGHSGRELIWPLNINEAATAFLGPEAIPWGSAAESLLGPSPRTQSPKETVFSVHGRDKWPHFLCHLDRVPHSSDSKDALMHLEPIACFARRMTVAPFAPWTWRLDPRYGVGSPRTESGMVDVHELQCLHYGESCGRCPRIATFDKRAGRLCLVWVAPAT